MARLLSSALAGDYDAVRDSIVRGADLNRIDRESRDFESALIGASSRGHTQVANLLLKNGAQIDLQDSEGKSALISASVYGQAEVVKLLLKSNALVNLQTNAGWSALIGASENGHAEIVEMLLQNGAQIDLQDRIGESSLMKASINEHIEVTRLLLQNGAEVDLLDKRGKSALSLAKNVEIINLLQANRDNEDRKKTNYDTEMEEYIKGIEEAIKRSGKIDRKLAHAMFVGPTGSGKSSLMDRLLGKLIKKYSPSTGVCNPVVTVDIELANPSEFKAATIEEDSWNEIACEASFVRQMGETNISAVQIEEQQLHFTPENPESEHVKAEVQPLLESGSELKETNTTVECIVLSHDATSSSLMEPQTVELPEIKLSPSATLPSKTNISDLIKKRGFNAYKNYLSKTSSLYLRDTGGQVEFQEMLALLTFGPSIFFFVFRADIDLEYKFEVNYRTTSGDFINAYTSSITTEEALLQSLASVYAMDTSGKDVVNTDKPTVKTHEPLVFIVGTHVDKLDESEKSTKITSLNKCLESVIESNGFKHLVQYANNQKREIMFTVDNTSDSERSFKLIRSRVNSLISSREEFNIEYPISYLLFCLDLQNIKKSIITLDECKILAARHDITGDQVFHLLRFLHIRIGLIRYFDVEGLQHIIVKEPEILFNKATALIVKTYCSNTLTTEETDDFVGKGILTLSAFKSVVGTVDEIGPEIFLQLLVHLRITAPFSIAGDQEKRYFIPCVLNHVPESTREDVETKVSPLAIMFKCRHCPKGIYGVLVTHLMRPEGDHHDTTFMLMQNKIFKDQVSFEVHSCGVVDEISLKILSSRIEIKFFPELSDENDRPISVNDVCSNIRLVLMNSISKCLSDLHYDEEKVVPVLCFKCDNDNCTDQFHPIEEGRHIIRCGRKVIHIPPGCPWFKDKRSTDPVSHRESHEGSHSRSTAVGTRLFMSDHHELTKLLEDLNNEQLWRVGAALGLHYPTLQRMNDILGEMVAAWLREDHEVAETSGSPSWTSLAKALRDTGHEGLAAKIQDR